VSGDPHGDNKKHGSKGGSIGEGVRGLVGNAVNMVRKC